MAKSSAINTAIRCVSAVSELRAVRVLPFFRDWHAAFVLGDVNGQRVIKSRYVQLIRSLLFWRYAPRKYVGGLLLNLLGVQFLRYHFYNLRYLARPLGRGTSLWQDCASDGYSRQPRLLSTQDLQFVQDFYGRNSAAALKHFEDFSELVISNTAGAARASPDYAELIALLMDRCGVKKAAATLTGLQPAIQPYISIIHYRSFQDSAGQQDGQNIPHADVFYPSFKLFIYLTEVDEKSGAFMYLRSSHRYSYENGLRSLKDTIQYYREGRRSLYPVDATFGRSDLQSDWVSINGSPGDGVYFNVQGVHRRGDFLKDRYRERIVLLVDFRQVEVPVQKLAANV